VVPPLLTAAAVSPNLRLGLAVGFVAILVAFYLMMPASHSRDSAQDGLHPSVDDASAPKASPRAPAKHP
jgi:hypothetical protein